MKTMIDFVRNYIRVFKENKRLREELDTANRRIESFRADENWWKNEYETERKRWSDKYIELFNKKFDIDKGKALEFAYKRYDSKAEMKAYMDAVTMLFNEFKI